MLWRRHVMHIHSPFIRPVLEITFCCLVFTVAMQTLLQEKSMSFAAAKQRLLLANKKKSKSLLHYSKFLKNANFDLVTKYILRDTNKQRFH